jgi:cell division protein FtsZ
MERGKRASMREGPLAALFRKTEEEGMGDAPGADSEGSPRPAAGREKAERSEFGQQSAEPRVGVPHPSPDHSESKMDDRDSRLEELRPAPPSARARHAEPEIQPERRVRSPEERLRGVFSSDIPENIMERAPVRPSGEELRPRYGREEPSVASIPAPEQVHEPILRVVGVGGAGVNAVNRMIEAGVAGVEFVAVNTDLQSLQQSSADVTQHIGGEVTRGLGSGSDPDLGRQAALDSYDQIKGLLKGSDMVFIAAGSGGGTGTGAAPVVARVAREIGALTVGIVTKPFAFEGSRRAEQAERGVDDL